MVNISFAKEGSGRSFPGIRQTASGALPNLVVSMSVNPILLR
jgi:hypothetical protein